MEDKSNLSLDFQFGLEAGELLDRVQQGQRPGKLVDLQGKIEEAFRTLKQGTGPGHEFLGWMELPGMIENESLEPILDKAEEFRNKGPLTVCIGIGGSYLGTKALIEGLKPQHSPYNPGYPRVLYAEHHLCED